MVGPNSPFIYKINIPEKETIWLTGFIDGEGYIGITRQRKKETSKQSSSLLYHPYLIISNNDLNILKCIKELIGYGYIHKINRKTKPHQKASFQYKLAKMDKLEGILRAIQPYLHLKQKQCELLLNFINLRENAKRVSGRGYRGGTSYTKEEEIYQKLRILNKRGI